MTIAQEVPGGKAPSGPALKPSASNSGPTAGPADHRVTHDSPRDDAAAARYRALDEIRGEAQRFYSTAAGDDSPAQRETRRLKRQRDDARALAAALERRDRLIAAALRIYPPATVVLMLDASPRRVESVRQRVS